MAEKEEFWDTLKNCLSALPEPLAHAFVMREMEEQDPDEVCRTLEMSKTDDLLNNYAGEFRAFVDALLSGQLYANVHTADNAAGAIRGQIGVVARGHRPYRR